MSQWFPPAVYIHYVMNGTCLKNMFMASWDFFVAVLYLAK